MYLIISKPLSLLIFFFILISNINGVAQSCTATITTNGRTVLCQGETTTLTANTGTGLTYEWIKDGTVIAGATGSTLQVSTQGDYQLRVSGPNCGTNTSPGTFIQVDPRPNPPGFTVTPTNATCSGTPLTFAVNAPIPDLVYNWTFGDGSTGRGPSVTHTYDIRGTGVETYVIEVFATSSVTSCESEPVVRNIQVNRLPEISFTEKSEFITCLPDTVADADISVTAEITNTTQEPYLSDIRSYTVDWGDGSAPVLYRASEFPISNPNPYTEVGDYEVVITALAGNGCTETFTQTYSVSKEPKAGFEIDKKREVETQMPPCVPVIVTPTDTATGGGLSYRWLIQPEQGWTVISGDTNSADPVFKFTESGVYTIEQIVTNACASDTASQSIIVGWPQVQPPTGGTFCGPTSIDFSGSGPAGAGSGGPGSIMIDKNLGEKVTVNVKITGPKSFTRTFTSESFNFNFNFDVPGTYTMTVEAINECGSSNQVTGGQATPVEFVILVQPTTPSVQAPGIVCEGDVVTLTPTGPGPIYAWFDNNAAGATPILVGPSFTTPALASGITNYYVAALDTANGVICLSELREIPINVRERIGNNLIEGEDALSVCKGGTVPELVGSQPTGGDDSKPYNFTWIQSTTSPDGGFTPATGTNNNANYTPGAISTTTWFRRVASSGSCSPDTSNAVQVIAVDPVPATANTIGPAQEICEGDTPQQLVGSQPAGGAGAPYEFLWEISTTGPNAGFTAAPGANTAANYTPQNLQAGETWFRRQVTSGSCTTPSEAIKIAISPALANNTITPLEQDVCTGVAPTAITGSAPTGGAGNYQYEWLSSTSGTPGSFTAVANSNTQSYTPGSLTGTTYFTRVVTSAACGADTSAAAVIRIRPAITGNSVSAPQEICSGATPAPLIGSAPTGGNGSFTYRWESSISGAASGFAQIQGASGPDFTPPALNRTTWFRRVAISQGCESPSEAVAITVLPLPTAPVLTVKDNRACVGGSATLTVSNANGATYRWYTTETGGEAIAEGPTFVTPELFANTIYYVEAINENKCISSSRTAATVTIVEPVADAGPDVTIIEGGTAGLRATGGATYSWEPAEGLSNPTSAQPVASPKVTTTYTVTVTTAEGCVATDEVTVTVIPGVTIPNAFTPNRDGVNETWEIENIEEYPEVKVEIFNRWGNVVFTSNGYGEPWDGTLNGSDLPVATYYYMIYLNKEMKPISGHVTIIR